MTRWLNGRELQGFIQERQAKQVRNLRQEHHIEPRLVIIKSVNASEVIDTYVRMKVRYAEEIGIRVDIESLAQADMIAAIERANADDTVQGIIVQLPLDDPTETEQICETILPTKDVDGLGAQAAFPSATAEAIDWLLAGYNVQLTGKQITLVGYGKLVGRPLERMWTERGYRVAIVDKDTPNRQELLAASDVIVTATGSPRVLTSELIPVGVVVVDAGTASEGGVIVGDIDPAVYETRHDLTLTPQKGGVGPLTYTLLFDHVIQSALRQAGKL